MILGPACFMDYVKVGNIQNLIQTLNVKLMIFQMRFKRSVRNFPVTSQPFLHLVVGFVETAPCIIYILLQTHRLKGKFYAFYIMLEGIHTVNVSPRLIYIIHMQMEASFCHIHAEAEGETALEPYLCSLRIYAYPGPLRRSLICYFGESSTCK